MSSIPTTDLTDGKSELDDLLKQAKELRARVHVLHTKHDQPGREDSQPAYALGVAHQAAQNLVEYLQWAQLAPAAQGPSS